MGKKKNTKRGGREIAAASPSKILSFPSRAKQFLREVKAELKRVTWPTKKEVIGTTIVVLIMVFFFTVYLYIWDVIFAWIIEGIRRAAGG